MWAVTISVFSRVLFFWIGSLFSFLFLIFRFGLYEANIDLVQASIVILLFTESWNTLGMSVLRVIQDF